MIKKDTVISQKSDNVFYTFGEKTIGRSTYLIERHFTGNRSIQEAIYTAVENEAKRVNQEKESA